MSHTYPNADRRSGHTCPGCAQGRLRWFKNKDTLGWFLGCNLFSETACPFKCCPPEHVARPAPRPRYERRVEIERALWREQDEAELEAERTQWSRDSRDCGGYEDLGYEAPIDDVDNLTLPYRKTESCSSES